MRGIRFVFYSLYEVLDSCYEKEPILKARYLPYEITNTIDIRSIKVILSNMAYVDANLLTKITLHEADVKTFASWL